jgi:NAD(P)-dependent dehydrogenase (short-subunit alcohol dehydrogenase family)
MNALVTGTSRGLGRAVARRLAHDGARVLCHARSAGEARALASELGGVAISGDLSSVAGIADVARQASTAAPVLQLLVHNAAINPRPKESLDEVELETYRAVHAVNVEAPMLLTRALLGPLRAAGDAQVIVVSSEAGQFSNGMGPTGFSYRMSKAAVNAFTLVAAQALLTDGIRVNAVHPGWVRTDMGGPDATLPVEKAAEIVVAITMRDDLSTGKMFDYRGALDW